MIILLLLLIISICYSNVDDTFNMFLDRIIDIGIKQNNTIIYDVYEYPDDSGIDSMIDIIDDHHAIYTATKSNNDIMFSLLLPASSTNNDNKILLSCNITMTNFRLISIESKMYIIFIDINTNKLSYTQLYYKNRQFSINDDNIIYIDTNNRKDLPDECKNLITWVPVYNTNTNTYLSIIQTQILQIIQALDLYAPSILIV